VDSYERIQRFYVSVKTEKRIIGKSLFGRDIYAVKVGTGTPIGIAQYAIHGREYVTARLAVAQYERGVKNGCLWLVPLANPDGCLLSEKGLSSAPKEVRDSLLALNGNNPDFSLWKANGRGVDLNVNFAAEWGKGSKNVRIAGSENYIGEKPFSESESLALKRFTERIKPQYTVSYHTKGEEIYWYFHQPIGRCVMDKRLALVLSRSTGYPLAYAKNSVGGYKDWCIQRLGIPSFTIEAGKDEYAHPLQENAYQDIVKKNKDALYDLSAAYRKL
jgi:g-D-glutamyl-meso-diaminopimelate peptidase